MNEAWNNPNALKDWSYIYKGKKKYIDAWAIIFPHTSDEPKNYAFMLDGNRQKTFSAVHMAEALYKVKKEFPEVKEYKFQGVI